MKLKKSFEKLYNTLKFHKYKSKIFDCFEQSPLVHKKGLCQNVPTRWNSTFLMPESFILYRCTFCQMQLVDSKYKSCPTLNNVPKLKTWLGFLKCLLGFFFFFDRSICLMIKKKEFKNYLPNS